MNYFLLLLVPLPAVKLLCLPFVVVCGVILAYL